MFFSTMTHARRTASDTRSEAIREKGLEMILATTKVENIDTTIAATRTSGIEVLA